MSTTVGQGVKISDTLIERALNRVADFSHPGETIGSWVATESAVAVALKLRNTEEAYA